MGDNRRNHNRGNTYISLFIKRAKLDIALLITCAVLYLVNVMFLKSYHSFMRNHFNDLIAMPAMLAYINIVMAAFKKQSIINLVTMLILTIICGFMWEVAAIYLKPNSVCDLADFFCYFMGAVLYKFILYLFRKKEI